MAIADVPAKSLSDPSLRTVLPDLRRNGNVRPVGATTGVKLLVGRHPLAVQRDDCLCGTRS